MKTRLFKKKLLRAGAYLLNSLKGCKVTELSSVEGIMVSKVGQMLVKYIIPEKMFILFPNHNLFRGLLNNTSKLLVRLVSR